MPRKILIAVISLYLSGCEALSAVQLVMTAGNAIPVEPCPQFTGISRMVPSELVPRENSKKVIVAAVVWVEPDKVSTIGFFPIPHPSDCWRRNGIEQKGFQDALQAALDSAGLTVQTGESRAPDFALEVRILEQAEGDTLHMLGVLTRRARLVARYSLKSPLTDELVWAKEISTEHEVKYGLFVENSPSPDKASVIAFETAIKLNLETFVRYLGDL